MPRLTAWNVLRGGSATPMRIVAAACERAALDPRNSALVRRMVGTEVRRRGTLRALVATFAKGKPSAELAAHLRIGFAQLFFMEDIPDHAALSETVNAATLTLGQSKGRYVNAVLREALRSRRSGSSGDPRQDLVDAEWHFDRPVFRDPAQHPLLWCEDALSMPAALMKRWRKRYGPEAANEIARLALEEPDLSLRVVHGTRDEMAAELEALELHPQPGKHESVLLLPRRETKALLDSDAFTSGRVTIQGETALRAALLIPAEAERVVDLCAAPGGKTAVLARTKRHVIAVDQSAARLAPLRSGLERLSCKAKVSVVAADGARAFVPTSQVDAVLVDAPCSNTGVLGRRPGARWRYGPKAQASLTELQERLLRDGAQLVRDGGYLVYSTCSLEPEENARQIKVLLEDDPSWTLVEEIEGTPATTESGGPVDGGYAALLQRSGA